MAAKVKKEIKISELTIEELGVKAVELRRQVSKTRLEMAAGKIKNKREVFNLRKKLARVLSVLNMKLFLVK